MTIALLIALIVVNVAYLVVLDRRDERAKDERALLDGAWREEVQVLLQRIQAPEAATYEHSVKQLPPDPDGMPMSDEQLAELEERQRMISLIEAAENPAEAYS